MPFFQNPGGIVPNNVPHKRCAKGHQGDSSERDPDPTADSNTDTIHLLAHVSKQKKWTLRHGFFALMGGFQVLMDSDQPQFFERPEGYRPDSGSILSAGGVLLLAQLGHIPASFWLFFQNTASEREPSLCENVPRNSFTVDKSSRRFAKKSARQDIDQIELVENQAEDVCWKQ
jgi:hypothetical protein